MSEPSQNVESVGLRHEGDKQHAHTHTTKSQDGQMADSRECRHNNSHSRHIGIITSCSLPVTRTNLTPVYSVILLFHTRTHTHDEVTGRTDDKTAESVDTTTVTAGTLV